MRLSLCPRCRRHTNRRDPLCPFCGTRTAALTALGSAALALAGCSSTVTEEPSAVGAYGVPPSDAAAEDTSDASDDTPMMPDAAYGPPPDVVTPDNAQGDAQEEDAWPMMDGAYAPPPAPKY